jgi:hypothetical protein
MFYFQYKHLISMNISRKLKFIHTRLVHPTSEQKHTKTES